MILYVFILLFIKLPYIMCDRYKDNPLLYKSFPIDDVDLDLKIPVEYHGPPCGEYGFRCLNKHIFEICQLPEDRHSDSVVEVPIRRECKEGYVCDENNSAFCTPIVNNIPTADEYENKEQLLLLSENDNNEDYVDASENTSNFEEFSENFRDTRKIEPIEKREEYIDYRDQIITTTDAPETSITEKILPTQSPIVVAEFFCKYAGIHSDDFNKTNFWYCEPKENGEEGLIARHMTCKDGEIFNKQFNACILPGVTIQSRNSNNPCRSTKPSSFSCNNKKSGKYADEDNCQYYHVCVSNKLSPIRELLFMCPKLTAYDPSEQKCTRKAMQRFTTGFPPPNNTNICTGTPSRFRQISDCQSYYICKENSNGRALKIKCPKGYRVDNMVMECLPKRIARCTTIIN